MDPSCTARLLSPLIKVASSQATTRDLVSAKLRTVDLDGRVPLRTVYGLLESCVEKLGDEKLGLRIGANLCFGQTGPYDYVVRSAATVRDAIEVASRYSPLLTDGFRIILERHGERSLIRFEHENGWPRAAGDIALSAAYTIHFREHSIHLPHMECWFPYETPTNIELHRQIFPGAILRFDAPCCGLSIARKVEAWRQPGAARILHAALRERLDACLSGTRLNPLTLAPRVRRVIEQQLRESQETSAPTVAGSLQMSRRTLSRNLRQEDTSFAQEFESVRHQLALHYVCSTERPLAEVAFLVGFSHVESFHRAFKRWTGLTPGEQRTFHVST